MSRDKQSTINSQIAIFCASNIDAGVSSVKREHLYFGCSFQKASRNDSVCILENCEVERVQCRNLVAMAALAKLFLLVALNYFPVASQPSSCDEFNSEGERSYW